MLEEYEDTKGEIRNRISRENRQHSGQKIPKGKSETYIEEEQTTQWPKDTKGKSETVYRRRTDNTMAKRYQRGNQKPYIEEEQTTQWPKEKVQKDKQRSTKHTYKNKDQVTRTPLKTGDELRCSRRVSSSCFTSGTRRVNLVANPVINRE